MFNGNYYAFLNPVKMKNKAKQYKQKTKQMRNYPSFSKRKLFLLLLLIPKKKGEKKARKTFNTHFEFWKIRKLVEHETCHSLLYNNAQTKQNNPPKYDNNKSICNP